MLLVLILVCFRVLLMVMINNETSLAERSARGKNNFLAITFTQVNSHYVVFGWVENGWSDPEKAADNNNGATTTVAGTWVEASKGAVGDEVILIQWRRITQQCFSASHSLPSFLPLSPLANPSQPPGLYPPVPWIWLHMYYCHNKFNHPYHI